MVLEIAIGSKADRFLQSVNQQTFDRLSNEIKKLAVNPHPHDAKKVLTEEGVLRYALGCTGFFILLRMITGFFLL